MTSLNPIALNPIGLQFLNPIASGLAAASNTPQVEGSSFLSFLNDAATELPTGSDTAFSDVPQRLNNRKQEDPLSSALLNMPVTPAALKSSPLPIKLSLNLRRHAPETLPAQDTIAPSVAMVPLTNMVPLTGPPNITNHGSGPLAVETIVSATPGLTIQADKEPAKSSAPRVNAELIPANSAPAPHLAFALRLNPIEQPTSKAPVVEATIATPITIEPAESVVPEVAQRAPQAAEPFQKLTAPDVVATPLQAPQASSGGSNADTNSGNHRPANRQSDASSNEVPVAVANGASIHSTPVIASQAPPAPSQAPSPSPTREISTSQHVTSTPAVAEAPKTGPANQLSFSVSGSDQQKVEVRVMDRAGEVHVSVRTPNEELASTLRSDLGSLTGKLTQSGYTTEAFTPATHGGELSHQQRNSADQQTNQQQPGGQGRSFHRQGQQQDSQQNGRHKRPAWLDELENSLAHAPASKRINVR